MKVPALGRCLVVLLALPALSLAAQEDVAAVGPLLARALAEPAPQTGDDGALAVWVFLADRGRAPDELTHALAEVEASLPARTLQRRAKVLASGARAVDLRDLAPAPRYLAAIAATGARERHQSRWLNAVSVEATPAQIADLVRLPFVSRLELVARFRRPDPRSNADEQAAAARGSRAGGAWRLAYGGSLAGLEQINVPPVHEAGNFGQGVVVGMLDSGFKLTHEALAGVTVIARHDFVDGDDVVEYEPGDPYFQHDHGTRTLSTIMGRADGKLTGPAFGASAILAKTEDVSRELPLEEDRWVAGLEWVESLGADIVSSSLGYHDWYVFADLDGNTAVATIAADLAVSRGLVVVNAAGNERLTTFGHLIAPADGDSVIAVGAVTLAGGIASFSSPGPTYDGRIKPDVAAQGVDNHVVSLFDDHGYATADGTSYACPLAAGVAALVLARAPMLTPLQVREALRMTADQAGAPDNDVGWGILDAQAAVAYWGATMVHQGLPDTENTAGSYTVTATITDRLPLDPARMHVVWRVGAGTWQRTLLAPIAGDEWRAQIPGQPAGSTVAYYLEVTDTADITTRLPLYGGGESFVFAVGPDTTPPTLVHAPLGEQLLPTWPPVVAAAASDNLGLDRVELTFAVNGGSWHGPFAFAADGDDYTLVFPLAADDLAVGDQVAYTVTAWDRAGVPNATASGPHTFAVIGGLARLLVIDDDGAGLVDQKIGADKSPLPPRAGRSSATAITQWLRDAYYTVDVLAAGAVGPGSLAGYAAVVYSAGDNASPMAHPALRQALLDWAHAGGRVFVEGGEVGYEALIWPGYTAIAHDVLHASTWRNDNGGALQVVPELESHPFLTQPHILPTSLAVTFSGYGDQDVVNPYGGALVVMDTAAYDGSAGVLVHDDNPAPQAGQVVYLACNVGALAAEIGRQVVENGVAYLLADEPQPTATITGTVTLSGGGDAAGVTVSVGPDHTVVTGADGTYQLHGLYASSYTVTAAKEGYATGSQPVVVAEGAVLDGVDFALLPAVEVQVATAPGLAIPDASTLGIASVIDVTATGTLSEISVDVTIHHTYIGELLVILISPTGTMITLHDRSGGSADNIVGNWPTTLSVDGPGALDDLRGEDIQGPWTLVVADVMGGDVGTLDAWGLNFQVGLATTAVDHGPPPATRLLGARPNPFNPQTTVAFDVARAGPVRLGIFDLRGRQVRALVSAILPAGRHEVRWDGRDAQGREAASGVYLCRLEADGVAPIEKLTLVR